MEQDAADTLYEQLTTSTMKLEDFWDTVRGPNTSVSGALGSFGFVRAWDFMDTFSALPPRSRAGLWRLYISAGLQEAWTASPKLEPREQQEGDQTKSARKLLLSKAAFRAENSSKHFPSDLHSWRNKNRRQNTDSFGLFSDHQTGPRTIS